MLIDNTPMYDEIWDKVDNILKFKPKCQHTHSMLFSVPFQIEEKHCIYGIENMRDEQIDLMKDTMKAVIAEITAKDKRIYALDWQHSAFLYDPHGNEPQKVLQVIDSRFEQGWYNAYFPSFYPDGDYHFFIEQDFEFGWLGHPWRQEIWIFGEKLIEKTEELYKNFGWIKIK